MSVLSSGISQPLELHVFIYFPRGWTGDTFCLENKKQSILDNSTSLEICIQGDF